MQKNCIEALGTLFLKGSFKISKIQLQIAVLITSHHSQPDIIMQFPHIATNPYKKFPADFLGTLLGTTSRKLSTTMAPIIDSAKMAFPATYILIRPSAAHLFEET